MHDELKLQLSVRRPGGQDDADPAIMEALACAASSPETMAWAESEKAIDAAISAKLRQMQPPAGLRETILMGAKASRRTWSDWFNGLAWRNFRNSELVAVAALLLILGSALVFRYIGEPESGNWQTAATAEIAKIEASETSVAALLKNMPAVRDWLVEQTCPLPGELPAPLQKLKIYGCSKLQWRGSPMSIVCFTLDDGREVHLVTISSRNLPAAPPEKVPVFAAVGNYTTASWSEGDASMMLVGKIDEAQMRRLMGMAENAAATPSQTLKYANIR